MNSSDGPTSPKPAKVIWFEIPVTDLAAAARFYGALLAWRFRPFEAYAPDYWLIGSEEDPSAVNGALVPATTANVHGAGTIVFVEVDDLDDVVARAVRLGGAADVEPALITETAGAYAIIRDPDGNRVGLWASGITAGRKSRD